MAVVALGEAAIFNPQVKLAKGAIAPYVAMETLQPFTRDVYKTENKEYRGGTKFLDGDILMARITPSLENGKTSIYRGGEDSSKAAFGSTEFIVIRGVKGKSLTDFLYYLFTSTEIRDVAIASMTGSSGRQRVQNDVLKNYRVKLPTLKEQQTIAATLGALDDKIESNRRQKNILSSCLSGIFKKFSSTDSRSYLSFDNCVKRLPVEHKHSGKTVLESGKFPVYDQSAGGILGFIDSEPEFVPTTNMPIALFGDHTCTWRLLDEPADVGPNVIPVVSTGFNGVSTIWLYFALQGKQKMQEYRRHWMELKEKEIVWMGESAQAKFLENAIPALARSKSLRRENRILASLRDTLLPELMSGRIRVAEARDTVQAATDTEFPEVGDV